MMPAAVALIVIGGAAGAVAGSFLSVVAYRLPRHESIVYPPSHCESCGARVRVYDNLPVVSWLALRGHCRDCGGRLSVRALAFETSGAALGFLFTSRFIN